MPAVSGFGSKFQRTTDAAPGSIYADVGLVRNISGPSISSSPIETTAHDTTGGWRTFVGGLRDGGEVTLEILYDPDNTQHLGLLTDLDDQVVRNYKVIFTDPTPKAFTFAGIVTGYEPGAPHDDALSLAVTVKVTGEPALA